MTSLPGLVSVQVGSIVLTADGKKLGIVKEVASDRFKVDARWAPDYWLGTEVIDSTSDDALHLFITKAGVGVAKLRGHSVDGSGVPSAR